MLSRKNLMITIIFALCLVSLAQAEEKEGSKIEPKLVYEKHFDFEIEQGKIGDDGNIFPTIFVTKDNEVLFYDNLGRIKKRLTLENRGAATISEDGKYVTILRNSENWWRKDVEKSWQVFDLSGKLITKGSYTDPYLCVIQLLQNGQRIVVFRGTLERWVDIQFYNNSGQLLNTYKFSNIIADNTTMSYYRWTEMSSEVNNYIAVFASNEKDRAWLAVFNADGYKIEQKRIPDTWIWDIAISPDGRYIAYTTQPSQNQALVLIDRTTDTMVKHNLEPNYWGGGLKTCNPQFIRHTKWFSYISQFNVLYIFSLDTLLDLSIKRPYLQWPSPTGKIITCAIVSVSDKVLFGVVVDKNELIVLSFEAEELFRIQSLSPIKDIQINGTERKLYLLSSNSLNVYKW